MTQRRRGLLSGLVVLILLLLVGGTLGEIGTVELTLWLLLVVVWAVTFIVWGGGDRNSSRS